ncbi:hypothetical protein [Teredinibacter turnerae]|uniref:hypothetical protein n=1 Tax=Teredinibacter turnerae TaxID=2426 RepID=UPI0030D19BC8
MKIEYRIPQDDYINIEGLIGGTISSLYYQKSSGFGEDIVAHMVALKIQEESYIRICTDEWSDTYKEAIDCYRLRVQKVENAAYAFKSNTKVPVEIENVSLQPIIIKKIDIYKFKDSEGDESVIYDVALLLIGDQNRVLLGIENTSIAGDIYLYCEQWKIEEKLKQYGHVRSITSA